MSLVAREIVSIKNKNTSIEKSSFNNNDNRNG